MSTLDVCHHEDASKPCVNPNCGLHSSFTTPAVSRNPSAVDLAALHEHNLQAELIEEREEESEKANQLHGLEDGYDDDSDDDDDDDATHIDSELAERQMQQAVEAEGMHMGSFQILPGPEPPPEASEGEEEAVIGPPETTPAGANTLELDALDHAAPSAPPVQITAPAEDDVADADPPAPESTLPPQTDQAAATESPAVELPPSPDPEDAAVTQQPELSSHDAEEQEDDINWGFDNMAELQAHVTGPDPLELFSREVPERSASFPPVPPLPEGSLRPDEAGPNGLQPEEELLIKMMTREVEDNGPFDSPAAQQGGLFGAEDTEPSFFDQINQSDAVLSDGMVMGGTSVANPTEDVSRNESHVGDDTARYEEGLPLISQPTEMDDKPEHAKKEVHFFDDEPDAEDFFSAINAGQKDNDVHEPSMPDGGGLQRKSTIQVIENQSHPYHSGGNLAASMSTAVSQVLAEAAESSLETSPNPLVTEEAIEDSNDFFSQLNKAPAVPEPANPPEDDIKAKWKAALADDDFLDDDEGFLPSDDEMPAVISTTGSLRPVVGQDGSLQGFKGPPPDNTAAGRYTPQPATAAYTPQQLAPQQPQPPTNPYLPQQQNLYQPQAPQLRASSSAYFPSQYSNLRNQPGPPPPPAKKAESFVDKKEGYTSPYDLPLDVVPQLKKRPSSLAQNVVGGVIVGPGTPGLGTPGLASMISPPMRSSSMGAVFTPPPTGNRPAQAAPPPKAKPQPQNFFEELPLPPPKPRAASAMGQYAPGPGVPPPPSTALPMGPARPESTQGFYGPPPRVQTPQQAPPGQVTPGMSPQQTFPQPSAAANRYSAAPQQMQRSVSYNPPPSSATASRYSPAPAQALMYQAPPAANVQTGYPPVAQPAAPPAAPPVARPLGLGVTPQPLGLGVTPPPVGAPPIAPPPQSKYAPKPAGPPQGPTPTPGLYAPPPPPRAQSTGPVLEQGFMSPPPAPRQIPDFQPPPQAQAPMPDVQSVLSPPPMQHAHSAPMAQQEASAEDHGHGQRRHSGEHMHSSRPGTAGGSIGLDTPLEEEEDDSSAPPPQTNGHPRRQSSMPLLPASQKRYTPGTATPPPNGTAGPHNGFSPPMNFAQHQMSPQKVHVPRTASPDLYSPPPPRSQSQSPGISRKARKQSATYERPASALAQSSSVQYAPTFDRRQPSIEVNFMKPTDITANDQLERWKGMPIFSWGFGGTAAVMFPKRTQRFSSDVQQMMVKVSPGEVDMRSLKDTLPLDDFVDKFPGPVWTGNKSAHKTKKKEILAYMGERIAAFESKASEEYDPEARQTIEEKTMLWKVVKIMVENDGVVEGSLEVEKAVREILVPEMVNTSADDGSGFVPMAGMSNIQPPNAERVDREVVITFRQKLLSGDREAAVWHAVDKRLWAHAMLVSSAVGRDLWKRVVEEFVKSEVKTLGDGSESLAVLYETLAGNWEDCVDELVPPSVRKGVPTMMTSSGSTQTVEERLNKWRETLGLILSNRTPGDQAALLALGRLLVSYNRVYAGHMCYIFARQGPLGGSGALFGGAEDPTTDFSLVGVDHRGQDYCRDFDAVLLSEIYELAVSLTPHAGTANPVLPHLQIFKLQHALILAENGHKTDAQKYCDSIGTAIKAWNKPSPYFHQAFFGALEDLTKRLQAAPREDSAGAGSKWIPKLTSDSVSSSMWGAFNKFVAGDDNQPQPEAGIPPLGDASNGAPAANGMMASQPNADMYGAYNSGGNTYQPASGTFSNPTAPSVAAQSYAAGRYAPAANSFNGQSNSYEPQSQRTSTDTYRGYEPTASNDNPYEPKPYEPTAPVDPYEPAQQTPSSAGFSPQQSRSSFEAPPDTPASNGYEPPTTSSYGYEPPDTSFTPYQAEPDDEEEEKPKPKKKGIMDDDDDDGFAAANAKVKKQEEKAAEEKRKQEEASGQKKGWLSGWFGGKKDAQPQSGPIKAKLGEESAFVYDPDLKRWVNKKAGVDTPVSTPPPPPPNKRASTPVPLSSSSTPAPPPARPASVSYDFPPQSAGSAPPTAAGGLAPPPGPPRGLTPSPAPSDAGSFTGGAPPPMSRSTSTSSMKPPASAPLGAAGKKPDAMEELLGLGTGPPTSRRSTPGGARKKKGGASRYVEVIPGQQ